MSDVLVIRHSGHQSKEAIIDSNQIHDVHWDNISGGYRVKQSGYSLYGYIPYALAMKLVDCSGNHNWGFNDVKVMIPASYNKGPEFKEGYKELLEKAGPKPSSGVGIPCTKRIIKELLCQPEKCMKRKEIFDVLEKEGYKHLTIYFALRTMEADGRIKFNLPSKYHKKQVIYLKREKIKH